jgi:hypothetical protein
VALGDKAAVVFRKVFALLVRLDKQYNIVEKIMQLLRRILDTVTGAAKRFEQSRSISL